MDKQQIERKEIPINARAVGIPTGMQVLYLEDYVHTFIKKLIKRDEEENGCEVFLYGYEFFEEGKLFLIVSGAYEHDTRRDNPKKIGTQYFPEETFLGTASIHSDGISEMNMEIKRDNERNIILKNFYIYYDQNEEMQNYLIEWSLEHRDYRERKEFEGAVQYGKIAQMQNKEEIKVSFLWNAMNILSFGFIICVLVYGIISINNYHKMKDMETQLADIATTLIQNSESMEVSAIFPSQAEAEVFQTQIVEEASTQVESIEEETTLIETQAVIPETITSYEEESTVMQTQEVIANQASQEESTAENTAGKSEVMSEEMYTETAAIGQYYVVQQGDTIQSICISVYGNTDRMDEVCAQNGITDPNNILSGQTLLLP